MQDGVIPLFSQNRQPSCERRRGGWSNQDLAELYRIEAALVQAGISVDTEMGETDEGDPWFAFCGADSCEVLVHVAIIDGEYHIAGTTASVIIKGHSFTDIVRQFMTREPAFMLGTARHNNVMIHPSSVLIAVFAAICLISDEQNVSLFSFGENDKANSINENRQDGEIFNVADQRQVVLGDFTFSPQQVFIILSAIAFSSSPIIQNNSLGLEAAFGVFDLIETGGSEAEESVEFAATEVREDNYLPVEDENTASKEYAQILSDRQTERVEAKASAADNAVLLESSEEVAVAADEAGFVEPETRESAYVEGTAESEPVEETQTVAADPEPLIQTPASENSEVAAAPIVSDDWVVNFFSSNAEFADASEEISSLIDSLEAELTSFAIDDSNADKELAGSDLPVLNSSLDGDETLTFPAAVNTPVITPVVEKPDFGIDVGNASNSNISELEFLFNSFEETYGDALIDDRYDRYVIHNAAAKDVAYDDNAEEMAILRYELEDGTPVYFMGLASDFEYQMV